MLLFCKLLILFISLWYTWSRFTLLKKKELEFGEISQFFESMQIGQFLKTCAGPQDRGLPASYCWYKSPDECLNIYLLICMIWEDRHGLKLVWPAWKNVYHGAFCNVYISAFSSEPSLYYSSFTLAVLNLSAQVHSFTQDFLVRKEWISLHFFQLWFFGNQRTFFYLFNWLWTQFHQLRTFGVHLYW